MNRTVLSIGVTAAWVCVASPRAVAQELYELDENAIFAQGCVPPCMCPMQMGLNFQGTFSVSGGPLLNTKTSAFRIDDIKWSVVFDNEPLTIMGRGSYHIRQVQGVIEHRMILKLKVGDDLRLYDSEYVEGGALFPHTIDINIAIPGADCFGSFIHVSASPVPEICGTITGIPCQDADEFCRFPDGTCDWADHDGACTEIPIHCPLFWDPVCGCDGVTYSNGCWSDMNQVSVDHDGMCTGGACLTSADCPQLGPDMGQYCRKEVGDCRGGGECAPVPQVCIDVYIPVCGCDGFTYSNHCYAAREGVNVAHTGACK